MLFLKILACINKRTHQKQQQGNHRRGFLAAVFGVENREVTNNLPLVLNCYSNTQAFKNSCSYRSNRFSVVLKKLSSASSLSMPIRAANTISHQMLSPILCSKPASFESPTGQRPCCTMVKRPTKPASVKNANASSSTDHSLPWCFSSSEW